MKKFLLFVSVFASFTTFAQQTTPDCSELFISEYYEGLGNNKAIEIYNPSPNSINLKGYFIARMNNGSTTIKPQGSFQAQAVQLPDFVLGAYETYVVVLNRTEANATPSDPAVWTELRAKANVLLSPSYDINNAMNFNGNDAMLLGKGNASTLTGISYIDIIGRIGEDPKTTADANRNGWSSVAPYNNSAFATQGNQLDRVVTQDHGMIKKASVKKGISNVTFATVTPFNPLANYDSVPAVIAKRDANGDIVYQAGDPTRPQLVGNWETLGWHTCDCKPLSVTSMDVSTIEMYPNPTTGKFTLTNVEKVTSVEVRNALGQIVLTNTNEGKNILSFDINEKSGVYFITVKDSSGNSATRKLIVQ